jgi:tetratricopeptide (TPR) repeat protein
LQESAGRYADASEAYRRTLEIDRDDFTTLNNLAYHLAVRERKPEEALPLATRAFTLARGNPQIQDTLGWIHHLLGNDREALPLVYRASRALPKVAEVQLHAAVVLAAMGRLDDAGRALDAAAAADPGLKNRAEYLDVEKQVRRQ